MKTPFKVKDHISKKGDDRHNDGIIKEWRNGEAYCEFRVWKESERKSHIPLEEKIPCDDLILEYETVPLDQLEHFKAGKD